jgi:uncharacterized phiE125 gp8 family phage protein
MQDIFALAEETFFGASDLTAEHQHLQLARTVAPPVDPLSLTELKTALKITGTADDALLQRLLTGSTNILERRFGRCLVQQTWTQLQDAVPAMYKLRRKPVLSVSKIEYIADENDDTWLELPTSYYYLAGDRVVARASWPSNRGIGGWKTTFQCGHASIPATPSAGDLTAAQAAVPADLVIGLVQLVGHLYENMEGQGPELKYEVIAKSFGALPPNVVLAIEAWVDWSLC